MCHSLIQGIHYYRTQLPEECIGLMHWDIGGFKPFDVVVVAAFDVDRRKVGKDLSEAVLAMPNCTCTIVRIWEFRCYVQLMGRVLDGFARHMRQEDESRTFILAEEPEPNKEVLVKALKKAGAEILVLYLPVGSEEAVRFYAECALDVGIALINSIPVFIASDPTWAKRFEERGLPIIGDDIKSQIGATIVHRTLVDLFNKRGVKLERTYQSEYRR